MRKVAGVFLTVYLAACGGLTPVVPKTTSAPMLHQTFSAPQREVWEAALAVIRSKSGNIINEDYNSSLLVFSTENNVDALSGETKTTYFNVLIKTGRDGRTLVFVVPRTENIRASGAEDDDFLQALSSAINSTTRGIS